jgi:hypothetical protein
MPFDGLVPGGEFGLHHAGDSADAQRSTLPPCLEMVCQIWCREGPTPGLETPVIPGEPDDSTLVMVWKGLGLAIHSVLVGTWYLQTTTEILG